MLLLLPFLTNSYIFKKTRG